MATTGYSGTPLAKKLGIASGSHVLTFGAPAAYHDWLFPLPPDVRFEAELCPGTDIVHLFCERRADLQQHLVQLRHSIAPATAVWVSWPKKASKVPTDITEDIIRELALPLGLVDIKVCAVSDIWSGLKLVIRKELR